MTTAGWDGIFEEGEHILWQGRPDGQIAVRAGNIMGLVFGLFFAGFALFWMIMAFAAGGFFWMFGLLHFTIGVGISVGAVYGSAYKRRHTWYTLTNRNAYIAVDLPLAGKRLMTYAITPGSVLDLDDGNPASVMFATRTRRTKNGTRDVRVGFERIADGRTVYGLLRKIRKEAG